ncbi:MAG: porin family protein [Muribaculaceae bacterium]|nr:porin family protein [Muribaculaceae bacterium]
MNEDWLNKVHDRMADYEIDEPENLWNDIESKRTGLSSAPGPMKRPVMIWVNRSIAVAAMIAVVITAGVYFFNTDRQLPDAHLRNAAVDNPVITIVSKPETPATHEALTGATTDHLIAQAPLSIPVPAKTPEPSEPSGPSEISEISESSESSESSEFSESSEAVIPPVSSSDYLPSLRPKAAGCRVSVSLYSGGSASVLNRNPSGDIYSNPLASAMPVWKDNLLMGLPTMTSAPEKYESDIKHRIPVRAGVLFTYSLTPRVGIESGLNYTILVSDIKEGRRNQYFTGEQKLRYIGIPLNLKYRILSWQRLDLYASAGVLAEKCVSAKIDKEFITNNQYSGSESENLSAKPVQWSVNASLGVQCNIVNSMSIFAEPGLGHYFDDGTDISTIYKEKSLNFNLNMGIRFTFGR